MVSDDVTVIPADEAPAARLRAHKAWIGTVVASGLDTDMKWFLAIDCGRVWYWPVVREVV